MGTKPKFWFQDEQETYWLFKQPRSGTGEDWAEKVVASLAKNMGLPCAEVELASCQGVNGSVTMIFTTPTETLIHGNELLYSVDRSYPRLRRYDATMHTFSRVTSILAGPNVKPPLRWQPPPHARSAVDVFVGYLVLDALVGNTDRHHENWGLIRDIHSWSSYGFSGGPQSISVNCSIHLAPTFDHASSLGRELRDERRARLLEEKRVPAYGAKSRSAMYRNDSDRKPLSTMDLVREAAQHSPEATIGWVEAAAKIVPEIARDVFAKVPADRITPVARRFGEELLAHNAAALRELCAEIQS